MSDDPKIDGRAAWVENYIGRTLTDFQRRAVALLCQAMRCGPYDFAKTFKNAEWEFGRGVRFKVCRPPLSTYDTDGLTALVIGAHDQAIRVDIDPCNFTHIAIIMHPRQRVADQQHARHPSIEHAIATYRWGREGGRTPTDYALEHAEYMAKAAERLLVGMHEVMAAEESVENADCDDADGTARLQEELQGALERQGDRMQGVISGIYEFRKRRDRAAEAAR